MRNRLIELLRKADEAAIVNDCDYPTYEKAMQAFYTSIADYLLANGVIVPPCAVGDTVYEVVPLPMLFDDLKQRYTILEKEFDFNDLKGFGDWVFLTKEEAEAKLKELEGDKK